MRVDHSSRIISAVDFFSSKNTGPNSLLPEISRLSIIFFCKKKHGIVSHVALRLHNQPRKFSNHLKPFLQNHRWLNTKSSKKMSTRVIFFGGGFGFGFNPFNPFLLPPMEMEKHTIFKCTKNTNPVAPRDVRHIVVTQVNDARAHPTCIVGCDMVGFICVYNTLKMIHLASFRANCYNSQIFIF